jgi:metal-dependent amidase/aminoacylase/carboxypeptidase family protein
MAKISGTYRSFSKDIQDLIPVYIKQIAGCLSAAFDVEFEVNCESHQPPVINNRIAVDDVARAAEGLLEVVWQDKPNMAGDDFSYFADAVPSCYFGLGCRNIAKGINFPLHSDLFDVDENCIQYGIDLLTKIALDY